MISNLKPGDMDVIMDAVKEDTEARRLPDTSMGVGNVEGFCDTCN